MAEYLVRATGCDDSTRVVVELTDIQAAAVRKVAEAVTGAGGGCQPTLSVVAVADADGADYDWLVERANALPDVGST